MRHTRAACGKVQKQMYCNALTDPESGLLALWSPEGFCADVHITSNTQEIFQTVEILYSMPDT